MNGIAQLSVRFVSHIETGKLFSKMVVPMYLPNSSIWAFQLFNILAMGSPTDFTISNR